VVAFQWCSIQAAILEYLDHTERGGIRVRLEDLVTDPGSELRRLATALHLPWDDHLESCAADLPKVNAGKSGGTRFDHTVIGDPELRAEVQRLADRFAD